MNLEELIARARAELNARILRHNELAEQINQLRAADTIDVAAETALREQRAAVQAEINAGEARLAMLEAEQRDEARLTELAERITPTGAPSPSAERDIVQARDKRTYNADNDPRGLAFLSDVSRAFLGDWSAQQRLSAHTEEERAERGEQAITTRAVTGAGSPGLVVPQYLIDLYAPKGRPGRHFADSCRPHPLPATGLTVYIPRQTATTAVGLQTAELDTVTESDYDDELIAIPVRTAAGSQTISRQFAERGLGGDDIVMEDLLRSYDVALDALLLNSATWGLLAVAGANTYTAASPTGRELYSKILAAGATVEDTLLDLDEQDLFTLMRGRRWKWMQNQADDKWPLISQPSLDALVLGKNDGTPYSKAVRGHLPNGGDVVTDNNLPANLGAGTNEDPVVVVSRQEAHLWEDSSAPLFIRAEQTQAKKLGIDLVVYGYFAACFDRVAGAHQKIAGTGLVTPAF